MLGVEGPLSSKLGAYKTVRTRFGLQVKVLKTFEGVPPSLGSSRFQRGAVLPIQDDLPLSSEERTT